VDSGTLLKSGDFTTSISWLDETSLVAELLSVPLVDSGEPDAESDWYGVITVSPVDDVDSVD